MRTAIIVNAARIAPNGSATRSVLPALLSALSGQILWPCAKRTAGYNGAG